MLLNDLYNVSSVSSKDIDGQMVIEGELQINKAHKIFEGHFPGLPVMPGVCMMQMVKELVAFSLKRKYEIVSASNMKFLSILNPQDQSQIRAEIKYSSTPTGAIDVDGKLYSGAVTYFKIKATLKAEQ